MIDIFDIDGNILISVPITQECEREEELMKSDKATLSWNSSIFYEIPAGSYIVWNDEKLSLIEPYRPEQKDEMEYSYKPEFHSFFMSLSKVPFFMYTYADGIISSRETDWTLTDNPLNFMRCICDAIYNETGIRYTYLVSSSLPASASMSFNSVDVITALNNIANIFGTEWYVDKSTNTIYLDKASFGDLAVLSVGENIGTPSITNNKEGYYTRFYAFGSTRNIDQGYNGSNVNNIANKRLTLDPTKYPGGYKDVREVLKEGEIFSKVLLFDNIYPSSELSVSDVRARLMYRLDSNGSKIKVGETDDGEPIYDQYSIWYFQINGYAFDKSDIIEGLTLSASFISGSLQGREFELVYHDSEETLTSSDGTSFIVKKGDYEIKFIEENTFIIPSMTGLIPKDGDSIVLFNIKMTSEYTESAYARLESELDKEIERMSSDLSNYQFKSYPHVFANNNPNLYVGRVVKYKNGSYSYTTRVIKLVTNMDFNFIQTITIGNEVIKGNTQQLKEDVASANNDINLLSVFNNLTKSIQQSYARTQQMMLDGFAAIKDIWELRKDNRGKYYAFSRFNVVSQYDVAAYKETDDLDLPGVYEGLPIDTNTLKWVDGLLTVVGGTDEPITRLSNLTDVSLSELNGGDTLVYDSESGMWINGASQSKVTWDNIDGKPENITSENIDALLLASHTHDNKEVIDSITSELIADWNKAFDNIHTHDNKEALDIITQAKIDLWDKLAQTFYFDDNGYVHSRVVFVGDSEISAYGAGSGSSGGGGSVVVYDGLDSTDATVSLSANQGRILKSYIDAISIPEKLPNPKSLTFGSKSYDGSSGVSLLASDLGALTSHQNIHTLTINGNGSLIGTYTPNSSAKAINITPSAIGAAASSHTHLYAGSSTSGGSATSAEKLTTVSKGSASLPVYFDSTGVPVACTAASLFSSLTNSGNSLSVTVAGQNRTLTIAYATSAGSATSAGDADTLDGYHGSCSNDPSKYVRRGSDMAINVGYIYATGRTGEISFETHNSKHGRELKNIEIAAGTSYAYEVILLLPVPASNNLIGNNYCSGRINAITTGDNQCAFVDINIHSIYNKTYYNVSLTGNSNLTNWTLQKCTYNAIEYYCLVPPYRANRVDYYTFTGTIASGLSGGSSSLNLPYRVIYKHSDANGNVYIDNSEINSSLTTTLTSTHVKTVETIGTFFNQGIYPIATREKSLGNSTRRWKDLYIGGHINIESDAYGVVIKRLNSNAGAFVQLFPANQDTYYWLAGSNAAKNYTLQYYNGSSLSVKMYVGNNGYVGIGNSSPSQMLDVTGNILASGEITAYSDARLKSNIKPLEYRGFVNPVEYDKDGKHSIGFVAQDVQKLYPELVTVCSGEEGYLSLNYQQYTAVLQAQIIELNRRIEELEETLKKGGLAA